MRVEIGVVCEDASVYERVVVTLTTLDPHLHRETTQSVLLMHNPHLKPPTTLQTWPNSLTTCPHPFTAYVNDYFGPSRPSKLSPGEFKKYYNLTFKVVIFGFTTPCIII